MPNRLGPLEVNCDAPPYNIVRACQMIGIQAPEDVCWTRLSQWVGTQPTGREGLKSASWKTLFGMSQPENAACKCGQKLPLLERYTFTLISGKQMSYYLGQCRRCRCVYWQQA